MMFLWQQGYDGFNLEVIEGSPRVYVTPEGNHYPSMTSVLSVLSRDGIEQWKKRVGEKAANKISRQAANRGTNVHSLCEKFIANERINGAMPAALAMFNSIKPIMEDNISDIYTQEASLYSDSLGVAGRVDLVAKWNGIPAIIDFKTSRKPKKEEWVLGYYLQTTGYSLMFEERYGVPIKQIVILIAVDGEDPQIFISERDKYIRRLESTIALYHGENKDR